MPKVKAKSDRYEPEEPEPGPSSTQPPTLTQVEKNIAGVPEETRERRVNDLVQYLLIQDQRKIPIKKLDINKHVLKEYSKMFSWFFDQAKTKLKEVFGINLCEVDGKTKLYILVSTLDNDTDEPHQQWSEDDNARMGLVMVILSIIFMNGNVLQDSVLYHTLKKLGVDIEEPHELFGDVKRLITQDLVRQAYLEYTRQPSSDPPTFEFRWGARAKLETTKRNVLDFVCQIYGNEPDAWTSQWHDVQREEGGNDQTMQEA